MGPNKPNKPNRFAVNTGDALVTSRETRQMCVHVVVALSALLFVGANARSIASCGTSTDILQNAVFASTPSTIDGSQPATITASGKLSAAITTGKLEINGNAIISGGIFKDAFRTTAPFTSSPGRPDGETKIVIGPFSLPKIPFEVHIIGSITGTDNGGKQIFCLAFDIDWRGKYEMQGAVRIPAIPTTSLVDQAHKHTPTSIIANCPDKCHECKGALEKFCAETDCSGCVVGAGGVTDCSGDSDHLKNRKWLNEKGKVGLSGDLDLDLDSFTVIVDLNVKIAYFFNLPAHMMIPISISPSISKGPISATLGPHTGTYWNEFPWSVVGNIKASNSSRASGHSGIVQRIPVEPLTAPAGSNEIICLHFNVSGTPPHSAAPTQPIDFNKPKLDHVYTLIDVQ